jgi:hypothetical protein
MMAATNNIARWSSPVARQPHKLKVGGSNPSCASKSVAALGSGYRGGCAAPQKQPRISRAEDGAARPHTGRSIDLSGSRKAATGNGRGSGRRFGASAKYAPWDTKRRLGRLGVVDTMNASRPLSIFQTRSSMDYVPPPGISLLFCSRAKVLAAPAEERAAYYAIVEGLVATPGSFGFRRETTADLESDDVVDRRLAVLNDDWGTT